VLFVTIALAGCGGGETSVPDGAGGPDSAPPADAAAGTDAGPDGGTLTMDLDGDGLDDAREAMLAAAYLPYLSIHPSDSCPLGGIVYRERPHPSDPTKISIIYDHLFQRDCGFGGHVGDDEVFGVSIDPAVPPPDGILSIRTISHQGTLCERTNNCGRCTSTMCQTHARDGLEVPVVYSADGKHGNYLTASCTSGTCADLCSLNSAPAAVDLVNAGEPGLPLVTNLTTQGFITAANGWTEPSEMDYDPWSGLDFGTAGNVAGDLTDDAFVTPVCP
jgi:hypothetical protein